MFTVEIGFKGSGKADAEAVLSLLASWHKNGQIYEWQTAMTESGICVYTQEADYKACDTLQMHCTTGERFGEAQLGKHDSSLSRHGRGIAKTLSSLTGIPVYYFLHKACGTTLEAELRPRCPSCGGEWLLPEPWCRDWCFKCDVCHLVSGMA